MTGDRAAPTGSPRMRGGGRVGAMDRGTGMGVDPGGGAAPRHAAAGRIPLAVVVVDRDGQVSHWSTGARRLFGVTREDAVGRPAADLLPVSGALPEDFGGLDAEPLLDAYGPYEAYDGLGPDLEASLGGRTAYATAGRARISGQQADPERTESGSGHADERLDVLWWAYPLIGPGPARLLVLAADATRLRHERGYDEEAAERIAPGFARYTELPASDDLARRLPEILPNMGPELGGRIVYQVLELGYPVLEFSQYDRVPVTPDWGVPRRAGRRRVEAVPRERPVAVVPVGAEHDLEYAAVRER